MDATVERFLKSSTRDRLTMVQDASLHMSLQTYFGQKAFDDYRQLAMNVDTGHLAITHPANLIFVPGVICSYLKSKTKGGIWWIDVRTLQRLNDLRIQPDGTSDADPKNAIVACAIDSSYEGFLTAALDRADFGHDVFPYDWRKAIAASTGPLHKFITDTYADNSGMPVHLVAHSMGGLVVRATLMAYPMLWSKVGRIVFIGTPHYGSQAIGSYLKNHLWGYDELALLGQFLNRETFRSMWGVLSLLPAPCGVYPGTRPNDPDPWSESESPYRHPCANFDMYTADSWQLGLSDAATENLQTVLDAAANMHRSLNDWHQSLMQEQRDRMLVIAGVGYQTLFRLEYNLRFWGHWEKMRKVLSREPGNRHREGDARVPVASAVLENVMVRYVRGIHRGLPNIPAVLNDVFHWLNDEELTLSDTPEGALSQHLAPEDNDSVAPYLDGTAKAQPFSDDSGLWGLDVHDAERLQQLQAELNAGRLPEFQHARLL